MRSMSLREYYWTEWFNVDRPEVRSGLAQSQTRTVAPLTRSRHPSSDNETLQAIRDPVYRHMLPPLSLVAQAILTTPQNNGRPTFSDAFVPPCGGTLMEPIVPLEVGRAYFLQCTISDRHIMFTRTQNNPTCAILFFDCCCFAQAQCQVDPNPTDWNPSIRRQTHDNQRFQPVEFCSSSAGLLCVANGSSGYPCNDYRVRYLCPCPTAGAAEDALPEMDSRAAPAASGQEPSFHSQFPYWTPWLNRDSPQHSGGNDNELLLDFQMSSGLDPCSATAPWMPGTLNAYDFFRMHSEMDDPIGAYEAPGSSSANRSASSESDTGVDGRKWRFLASVGQRVEARWRGRQHWYPGMVTKVLEAPDTSGVLVDLLYVCCCGYCFFFFCEVGLATPTYTFECLHV